MTTYQMFWDCSTCGTKKLLGVSHRHCPNCGAVQDETKRYFPPEGEEVELHNHKYYGVDWDCQYCSTPNSINSNNCVNCGASKEGAYDVNLVGQSPKKIKNIANNNKVDETTSIKTNNVKQSTSPEVNSNKKWIVLAGIIFALLIGFLVYGFLKVEDHTLTVNEKTWTRSVNIETFSVINDSEWCSGMPSDAYRISSYREVRSHKQVADGQSCHTERTDRGDGSYSSQRICETKYRSEPVYDNKCSYSINRWKFSNTVLAKGGEHDNIQFPDVSRYTQHSGNFIGNTREGSRDETYKIGFTYKDKDDVNTHCLFSQNKWTKFNMNNKYAGRVRMIGGLICNEVSDTPVSIQSN